MRLVIIGGSDAGISAGLRAAGSTLARTSS
jgi:hypothetical protein